MCLGGRSDTSFRPSCVPASPRPRALVSLARPWGPSVLGAVSGTVTESLRVTHSGRHRDEQSVCGAKPRGEQRARAGVVLGQGAWPAGGPEGTHSSPCSDWLISHLKAEQWGVVRTPGPPPPEKPGRRRVGSWGLGGCPSLWARRYLFGSAQSGEDARMLFEGCGESAVHLDRRCQTDVWGHGRGMCQSHFPRRGDQNPLPSPDPAGWALARGEVGSREAGGRQEWGADRHHAQRDTTRVRSSSDRRPVLRRTHARQQPGPYTLQTHTRPGGP